MRLKNKNKVLKTKNESLETENKRLLIENEQYKAAVNHSVEVATKSKREYENVICNYKEVIKDIYDQINDFDVNKLNSILCKNKIPGFQNFSISTNKICYSNFKEANNRTELKKIHEIGNNRNIINTEPSIPYSYSFYDISTSESTSNRNMAVEEYPNSILYNYEFDSF
ncbi:hypothetical protein F8M41_006910 [Gigaspora margarita]|uniref:Uncharacterized protein n=1 Tax=Gigaspora margarita TaxID=4874 RepID=A0A8H4A4V7_GIGMA|nr:hypothetical protein F8M41_006910 [Gigaspora margarita]